MEMTPKVNKETCMDTKDENKYDKNQKFEPHSTNNKGPIIE